MVATTIQRAIVLQTFLNNLGFSLYATLSACYRIITSEIEWSPREVSFNKWCVTEEY